MIKFNFTIINKLVTSLWKFQRNTRRNCIPHSLNDINFFFAYFRITYTKFRIKVFPQNLPPKSHCKFFLNLYKSHYVSYIFKLSLHKNSISILSQMIFKQYTLSGLTNSILFALTRQRTS